MGLARLVVTLEKLCTRVRGKGIYIQSQSASMLRGVPVLVSCLEFLVWLFDHRLCSTGLLLDQDSLIVGSSIPSFSDR